MTFNTFKMGIIAATGLDKDALHIYVGITIYILCLFVLRPIFKGQGLRSFMAVIIVTGVALAGEYLDNRHTIEALGWAGINRKELAASIHDLINTCLLSYLLLALMNWTAIFQPTANKAKPMIQRHKKTDY